MKGTVWCLARNGPVRIDGLHDLGRDVGAPLISDKISWSDRETPLGNGKPYGTQPSTLLGNRLSTSIALLDH